MITAARTMQPLPVRPVDPRPANVELAPQPRHRPGRTMYPLPVPNPEHLDLVDAIRTAALQRMLDRHGVRQPLPVVDPSA